MDADGQSVSESAIISLDSSITSSTGEEEATQGRNGKKAASSFMGPLKNKIDWLDSNLSETTAPPYKVAQYFQQGKEAIECPVQSSKT